MKVTLPAQNEMKVQVSTMLLVLLIGSALWHVGVQAKVLSEDEKELAAECASMLQRSNLRRAFHLVSTQMQSQGLRLKVQGCPFVRVGSDKMQQVLDVRVWVADSDVAVNFVRGPLEDGQEVDMGDVQLALPQGPHSLTKVAQQDVSPDVVFNREWLARVMAAQGLQTVAGHWWAFVPVHSQSS